MEDKCLHSIRFLFNQICTSFTTKQYKLVPESIYTVSQDPSAEADMLQRNVYITFSACAT